MKKEQEYLDSLESVLHQVSLMRLKRFIQDGYGSFKLGQQYTVGMKILRIKKGTSYADNFEKNEVFDEK